MSRRALFGIGTALAVVVATSVLAFQLRPDVQPVTVARQLLDLPGSAPHYWWLSGSELLLLRDPANPTFVQRDINAEVATPLPGLGALFQRTEGSPETIRVSPDGSYLLWSPKDQKTTIVFALDNAKHDVVTHRVPSLHVWGPDSKHWTALEIRDGRLGLTQTYSLDKPQSPLKTMPLSAALSSDQTNLARAAITTQGQFLVQLWDGPDRPIERAHLVLAAFTANALGTRQLAIEAPHANEGGEVFFLPEQLLMGWTLRFQPPLQQITGGGGHRKFNTGFWITDQHTRKTRALGYVETVRGDPNSGPYNVQLSPDGKYLSYVYRNALYLLPVTP